MAESNLQRVKCPFKNSQTDGTLSLTQYDVLGTGLLFPHLQTKISKSSSETDPGSEFPQAVFFTVNGGGAGRQLSWHLNSTSRISF